MNTLNRSEINQALSKAIAYKNCGKQEEAEMWARKLINLLECADILISEDGQQKNESQLAFEQAINEGRLSAYSASPNYCGKYMYMGLNNGRAAFKHIMTREYIS
jgi:hypothetical protein